MTRNRLLPYLAAMILGMVPQGLRATTINLNPISNAAGHIGDFNPFIAVQATPAQQANADAYGAMRRAADAWQSILLDNIVINIWVDFASLGANVLGEAGGNRIGYNYSSQLLPQISNHLITTPDPFLANLPVGTQPFPVILPAAFTFTGNIALSYANAKALGFMDAELSSCDSSPGAISPTNFCDGIMRFSRDFPLDSNRADGITPGTYDLEGIAMHEIGHILGFFSEVDTVDCMLDTLNRCGLSVPGPGAVDLSMLDLYRFADCQRQPGCVQQEPTTLASFQTAQRYMSTADPAVFVRGGSRYSLAQGFFTGDNFQASHWSKFGTPVGTPIGLLDPDVAAGETLFFSSADMLAFKSLGYNVLITEVPEPGSIVLMSSGVLLIFWRRRRRS